MSRTNFARHGIDFSVARRLWNDPDLLEGEARPTDEPRSLVIGRIDGKSWLAERLEQLSSSATSREGQSAIGRRD